MGYLTALRKFFGTLNTRCLEFLIWAFLHICQIFKIISHPISLINMPQPCPFERPSTKYNRISNPSKGGGVSCRIVA